MSDSLNLQNELWLTWFTLLFLTIACVWSLSAMLFRGKVPYSGVGMLLMAWLLLTAVISFRWLRVGHGPFITMYEILLSNIWSLLLIWLLAFWRMPKIRSALVLMVPLFFLFMGWLLLSRPGESYLPPTYRTIWLYIHVSLGKVFFGVLMVAAAVSLSSLSRSVMPLTIRKILPSINTSRQFVGRLLILALVFDTLMLIAGAIWAQDAWGRFWAWDPLETWSFMCWASLALLIHLDLAWKLSHSRYHIAVLLIFALAFVTFYGVPFISQAPHKGVI